MKRKQEICTTKCVSEGSSCGRNKIPDRNMDLHKDMKNHRNGKNKGKYKTFLRFYIALKDNCQKQQ